MDEQDLIQDLVEITFPEKDDFLKIRETLSRIGVASRKRNFCRWKDSNSLYRLYLSAPKTVSS